jgi:hypothetical protein
MAIQIGNQGIITASTRITVDSAKQSQVESYAFNVSPDGNACLLGADVTVYTASPIFGIGSILYTNIELTIPTTYSQVSNPNNPGQNYFILTGNTVTSTGVCD